MTTPSFLACDDNVEEFSIHSRISTDYCVAEEGSVVENGRTYQTYKEGKYLLPNDGEEQDRLNLQHITIMKLLDGRFGWAPIDEPRNVLDVGTGTGIWAHEFATKHQNSNVIGTDLSLIQPNMSNKVPNCSFEKHDAEGDNWTWDVRFDYVHLRMTFTCFDDSTKVMTKAFNHMAPGGWIEFQEVLMDVASFDGSSRGSNTEKFYHLFVKGAAAMGRDVLIVKRYKEFLRDVGFVDVVEHVVPFPYGPWPKDPRFKEIGKCADLIMNQKAWEAVSLKMFQAVGLSSSEIQHVVAEAVNDIRARKIHGYCPFYVIYGRKPHSGERQ